MQFTPLTTNQNANSFSCHARNPVRYQVAATNEDKPIIVDVLRDKKTGKRGVQFDLPTQAQQEWWREFGNQAIVHVTQNCEEWFGKKVDLRNVQKMFKAPVQTNSRGVYVTARVSKDVRVFHYSESGQVSPGRMEDLVPGMVMIPIVEFKGIFVTAKKFGTVIEISDFLIFPHLERRRPEDQNCGKPQFLPVMPEELHDVEFDGDSGPEALTDDDQSYDTNVFCHQHTTKSSTPRRMWTGVHTRDRSDESPIYSEHDR